MRRGRVLHVGVTALTGCTLLTPLPSDVSSGRPTPGPPDAEVADGTTADSDSGEVHADASDTVDGGCGTGVVLDSVGPNSFGAGGEGQASPLVWSHIASGENRVLFVAIAVGSIASVSVTIQEVKYNGAALAQVGLAYSGGATTNYTTLWALVNPTAGAHQVSVSFSGAPDVITAGSLSFSGVDQSTPYRNVSKASGVGNSAKVSVTSAVGNIAIGALVAGCNITSSGQSGGWIKNVNCGTAGGNGAASTAPGAPSVALSYSINPDNWGFVGADVNAAPLGSCSMH